MLSFIARGAAMSQTKQLYLYNVLYVYMLSFIARGASMSQPNRYIYIMYYMSVC